MKCIEVDIYESKSMGNCSNNGISSRYDEILLQHPHGYVEVDENNPPENFCTIHGGWYVQPAHEPKGTPWMSGGCIVYSSDSRFREISERPLVLFDRDETWDEYNMYSR